MGRRLNVSTPTVINTELVPLDESFYLDVDGQMEQWYYDNTEQYAPNRKITPLLLVPVISAFDKDTSTSYSPAFQTTQWFANEWNEAQGKYVETEITNQVDSGSADYVIQGNNLLVKKNVSYSHAVSIRCVATYIDPRDSGVTYTVEDSVNLTTNRTADVVFPEVDIISPSGRAYNPLVDDTNSQYNFKGVTTNNPVQPLNTDVRRYTVDVDGTEEILNSGEAVAPIMDIHYGENPTLEDQEFMYRQTAGGTLVGENIDKAYIERIKGNTVAWNQLVRNGNFVNTNSWNASNGTISASNNILTYTVSTPSNGQSLLQYNFKKATGHKFLFSCELNYSSDQVSNNIHMGVSGYWGTNYTKPVTPNQWFKFKGIATDNGSAPNNTFMIYLRTAQMNIGDTISIKNVLSFDLTLIYGEGNEPETVEEFEADHKRWFGKPLSYEEYDAGSLRPVLMNAIQTKGANNSWTKTQTMPITTLKGKLDGAGESVTIFPDGMKKCGEVYDSEQEKYIPICDEIFVDGGVVKAIKRVGSRAYESGDESDTSVITDGSTTTFYVLTTPQTYVLDPITDFVWYGIKDGQEVLADTLPWYVSGQGTDNLTVDAMYGENINVVLRCKMMDGETLSPSKAYATLSWRTPDIEPFVQSENGGAVRSNTEDMTFGTIININGEVLSDALKQKHLAFNWKIHKNNAAPNTPEAEVDKGWGQRITIDASDLRNVKGSGSSLASTLVYNHVYLKGAYEEVTDNGEAVTYNGEKVYDRPVD